MKSYNLKKNYRLFRSIITSSTAWVIQIRKKCCETLRQVGRWGRRSGCVLARSSWHDLSGGRRQDWQGRGHWPGSSGLSDLACEEEQDDQVNYESSSAQILTSLQTVMSVSLPGSEPVTPAGIISCPQVSLLAGHRDQNMCSKDTALVNEIFFCEVRI